MSEELDEREELEERRRRKRKKRLKAITRANIKDAPDDMADYQVEQWNTINEFEEKSWSDANRGLSMGWASMDHALEGLQTGFHIVAGDSNIGKTSFMSQMAWNVATMNGDDAYVIDFSLDDPMLDKMSRVIAAGKRVLINAVKTPRQYLKYPKMLQRRADGLKELREMVDCYKAYDQDHGTNVEDIAETIKNHIIELKAAGEKRKVVAFIDNFHDLTTDHPDSKGSDKSKYDYLAQYVSDLATQLDIPIVCSAEFKKLNGFRRPSIDDIRETVKIKYEAKSVMLCYNEVSLKGEGASVYFNKAGDASKQAVYEVSFAKNKYSKFKGRIYFEGYPEMAYFIEADEESTKRYNNVVYSNE